MRAPSTDRSRRDPAPATEQETNELTVSWEDYHRLIEHLALQLHNAQAPFDQIVALSRGGLRLGDALSRLFQRPLVVMAASSYGGDQERTQGELVLGHQLAHTCPELGPRLLLVDDLADSGATLEASRRWLIDTLEPAAVITAVLWCKAHSCITPDFLAVELPHNPWINQPFEAWDQTTPDLLRALGTPQSSGNSELG